MIKFFKKQGLRGRLIILLSSIALLVGIIATTVSWVKLRKEINDLFDSQQILFAERLASSGISKHFLKTQKRDGFYRAKVDDDALAFAIFNARGEQILNDGREGRAINFAPAKGFQIQQLVEDDEQGKHKPKTDPWRIFWLKHHDIYIAVGQEVDYRQDLINKVIISQIWSWLPAFPFMILGIFLLVSRELKPLKRLATQVSTRRPDELSLISTEHLPKEVSPLVNSLNYYFERTQTMLNRERRFTSDAAHELRSPLAGLRIQAEIAQMVADDPQAHAQALQNITNGIDRIAQLIEQLLVLSRLENINRLDENEVIHWQTLIEKTVSDLYLNAEQKQSDIYVDIQSSPQYQQGKPLLLQLILRNLIDNAINYTPEKSLIKITLTQQKLIVEDNGNGVSDEDLKMLGQPFFRPLERPTDSVQDEKGSGLGISIIQRISQLHHFDFQIKRSELGGLKCEVRF